MELDAYLRRIGYTGIINNSIEVLSSLHKAHTLSIPFENLDIYRKKEITIDKQKFYEKIVLQNRGGFCYEMNGLFHEILQLLKFKSFFISCNVYIPPAGVFGADFGHVAIIVDLGDLYLADVGFGDAFIEPLKIIFDVPQHQYNTYYKFSRLDDDEILLGKSIDNITYQPMFKFQLKERRLEEFSEMCAFHQHSPLAPFSKGKLVSKPTLDGRITLTEKGVFETRQGKRTEKLINDEKEFSAILENCFGMSLSF